MKNENENITLVVFANRKDFCLTKVCIASIRYYYPDIEILLVKDKLNGNFNTRRLCRTLNVQVLDMGRKYFGWGAAKIHFILNKSIVQKRYLCLDSDTIFVGKVLEELEKIEAPFVVSTEKAKLPFDQSVTELYLDPAKVKKYYPDYEFPGYFFNTGQIVVTPGLVDKQLVKNSFDPDYYPFYKNRDAFKLVDQAVLNAVLPVISKRKNIKIGTGQFMQWSVTFFNNIHNQNFENIQNSSFPYIVHYAGDVRTFKLGEMKGADILKTFKKQYSNKLSSISQYLDGLQDRCMANKSLNYLLYKRNRILIELQNRFKSNNSL